MIREKVRVPAEGAAEGVAQPRDAAAAGRDRVSRGDPAGRCAARSPRSARGCGSRWAMRPKPDVWDGAALPPHLEMNFRVVDAAERELASGRDLEALRAQLGEAAQLSFASEGPALEKHGVTSWDFGDLPETLTPHAGRPPDHRLSRAGGRRTERVGRADGHARGGRHARPAPVWSG